MERIIAKGDDLLKQGQTEAAILEYQKALQKNPQDGSLQLKIAQAQLAQGKTRDAVSSLLRGNEAAPQDKALRNALIEQLLQGFLGSPRRPKAVYEKLTRLAKDCFAEDPNSLEGLRIRGILALTDKRYPEAVQDLKAVYSRNPKDSVSSLALVEALFFDKNEAEAENLARTLIAANPSNKEAHLRLYGIYSVRGQNDIAAEVLESYVERNSGDTTIPLLLAEHYLRTANNSKADQLLQQISNDHKKYPYGTLSVANFYHRRGANDRAVALIQQALATSHPDPLPLRKLLIETYRDTGKRAEAMAEIEKAQQSAPQDQTLKLAKAIVLLDELNPEKGRQALQLLDGLMKENPADADIDYHRGRAYTILGQPDAATGAFREAVRKRRSHIDARMALAAASLDRRDYASVVRQMDELDLIYPENPRGITYRLRALQGLNRIEEARQIAQQAVKEFPNNQDILIQNALLLNAAGRPNEFLQAAKAIYGSSARSLESIVLLCEAYAANGQWPSAFTLIEEERKRFAGNVSLILLHADLYLRRNEPRRALQVLSQWLEQPNVPASILSQAASVHRRLGDYAKAGALLEQAIDKAGIDEQSGAIWLQNSVDAKDPAQVEKACSRMLALPKVTWIMQNNCAYAIAETGGDLARAEELARKAMAATGASNVKDTLGWILVRKGDYENALRLYRQIETEGARSPSVLYHRAMAEKGSRMNQEALANLRRALQLNPNPALREQIQLAMASASQ